MSKLRTAIKRGEYLHRKHLQKTYELCSPEMKAVSDEYDALIVKYHKEYQNKIYEKVSQAVMYGSSSLQLDVSQYGPDHTTALMEALKEIDPKLILRRFIGTNFSYDYIEVEWLGGYA